VGFPGESDADFEASFSLMQEIGIHKIHVFPFSVRPGTRAAFMKDKVKPEVKQARVQKMLACSSQLSQAWFESQVGKKVRVLVERIHPDGTAKGYTPHYLKVQMSNCTPDMRNTFQWVELKAYDLEKEMMLA